MKLLKLSLLLQIFASQNTKAADAYDPGLEDTPQFLEPKKVEKTKLLFQQDGTLKTDTLNKTASLSGFLETPKGTVVFCGLSDYLNISLTSARKKIDAMVKKNYGLAVAAK